MLVPFLSMECSENVSIQMCSLRKCSENVSIQTLSLRGTGKVLMQKA